jgi:hypothetical protein
MVAEHGAWRKRKWLAASTRSRYRKEHVHLVEALVTPGAFVRHALGDELFARVVDVYRAIFVNLEEVAACIPGLPPDAELLDVGGGDGALLDHILRRQPHVRAVLVDPLPRVGLALKGERRSRVELHPSTSVREYALRGARRPDAVVIADVLHHIPRNEREDFLRAVAVFVGQSLRFLAVKEVAHDGWRATLGLLSDWYVTGDRHVELLTPEEVRSLVERVFPGFVATDTPLIRRDAPNYCIVFEPPAEKEA